MKIRQHKKATTTPAIRAAIQQSDESTAALARRYNLTQNTVRKWRQRDFTHDKSSARNYNPSSINEREEYLLVCLRKDAGLSLDECHYVMTQHINANLTRPSIYRCFVRNGINKPPKAEGKHRAGVFDVETKPGFLHLDVKHLPRLKRQRAYAYVAIDRATRYVYVEILPDLRAKTAAGFLSRVIADIKKHDVSVRIILTDNGFEWTDRCAGSVKMAASGNHPVDALCLRHGINHRLTRIRRPQTNGMVERFNRRLSEALAAKDKIADNSGKNCFGSHAERNAYIMDFVHAYNRTSLKCLNHNSPLQSLLNHAKLNTYAGMTMLKP